MPRPRGHALNRDAWEDVLRLTSAHTADVASLAGIEGSTLRGLIGGRHRASDTVAHKIAAALGCRVATLFPTLAAPTPASEGRPFAADLEAEATPA